MLLSPSRADCIVFGVDGVLVDGSAASSGAAALCFSICRSRAGAEPSPVPDLAPYCLSAQSFACFETFADVVWALLSLDARSGELPSPRAWERELEATVGSGGLEYFAPGAPVERSVVSAIYRELYYGSSAVKPSLLKEPAEGTCRLEKSLFHMRWDKLRLPVGICTARGKNGLLSALSALEWQDFPVSRAVTGSAFSKPGSGALAALCRSLGARWPLYLGSSPADYRLMSDFGRGDFIAVGSQLKNNVIHFSSAADALRAILGVV